MKKFLSIILTVIIIISMTSCGKDTNHSSNSSSGANIEVQTSTSYKITGTGFTVSIPDSYTVFTKENIATQKHDHIDKALYEKIKSSINENANLIAISPDQKNEIQVQCDVDEEYRIYQNFDLFSEDEALKYGRNIEDVYKEQLDVTFDELKLVTLNEQRYMYFHGKNNGKKYSYNEFLQYTTYVDNVSFTMVSRPLGDNFLTENDKNTFSNVFNSLIVEYQIS